MSEPLFHQQWLTMQTLIKHALAWPTSVYVVNLQKTARNTAI